MYYNVGGLVADGGELLDAMKDHYWYEKTTNPEFLIKLAEEGGDVLHWLQAMCLTIGLTLEDLMRVNKAKLGVRYPDGFTKACAANRDKAAEWKAMEDVLFSSHYTPEQRQALENTR